MFRCISQRLVATVEKIRNKDEVAGARLEEPTYFYA
jgi:hypothetical protein